MTIDQDALHRQIRETFGTDTDPARWSATVVLNVLDGRALPNELRMTPSEHEAALVRYLARCDLLNLRRMLIVEPDYVRAFAIYAYERGGLQRLRAIAANGPPPDAALVREAREAYELARLAGEHIDAELSAGRVVNLASEHFLSAYRSVEACAVMVPRLAGALDRALGR